VGTSKKIVNHFSGVNPNYRTIKKIELKTQNFPHTEQ